eukprot:3717601-Lingulodinium_polyedra.AAC.1
MESNARGLRPLAAGGGAPRHQQRPRCRPASASDAWRGARCPRRAGRPPQPRHPPPRAAPRGPA